jgi:hypothetical protein
MADATLNEVIARTLQKLSVLEGGETAEAEDVAKLTAIITACNEDLREREICHWSDAAFPQAIKETFCDYVACHAVGDYPSAKNLQRYDDAKKERTLADLRRLTASKERVDKPTRAEYF